MKFLFVLVFWFFEVSNIFGMSLKEGMLEVLMKDPEIKEYEARLKELGSDLAIAKGNYFPTLNLDSTTSYIQNQYGSLDDSQVHTMTLELKQNLFNGFSDINKVRLESARERSAFYNLNEKKNSIALEYVTNYMNVLQQKDIVNISKLSLDYHVLMYEKILRKVNIGLGRQLEKRHSRTSLDLAKLTYEIHKRNLDQQKILFQKLMQRPVPVEDFLAEPFEHCTGNTLESYTKQALLKHPAVLVATKNAEVANFEYAYAKRYYFPTIDFSANYNYDKDISINQNENTYDVNIKLSYNLFNGLKDLEEERKQVQRLKQKDYSLARSKRDIRNRLYLTWNSFQKNLNNYEIVQLNVASKKATLNSYNYEFLLGRASLNAMLDATQSYYTSLREMVSSYYTLRIEQYKLMESIGVLVEYIQNPKSMFGCETKKKVDLKLHAIGRNHFENNKKPYERGDCYTVSADKLYIRSSPNQASQIKGFLIEKMRFCSKKSTKGWIKVDKGWVNSRYVKKHKKKENKSLLEKNVKPINLNTDKSVRCYRVIATLLHIRQEASVRSNIVGTYKQSTKVCVDKETKLWAHTKDGWIYRKYLQILSDKGLR